LHQSLGNIAPKNLSWPHTFRAREEPLREYYPIEYTIGCLLAISEYRPGEVSDRSILRKCFGCYTTSTSQDLTWARTMRRASRASPILSDLLLEILHSPVRPWYRRAKTIERVIVRSQNACKTRGAPPGFGGLTTGYSINNAGSDNSQPDHYQNS